MRYCYETDMHGICLIHLISCQCVCKLHFSLIPDLINQHSMQLRPPTTTRIIIRRRDKTLNASIICQSFNYIAFPLHSDLSNLSIIISPPTFNAAHHPGLFQQ